MAHDSHHRVRSAEFLGLSPLTPAEPRLLGVNHPAFFCAQDTLVQWHAAQGKDSSCFVALSSLSLPGARVLHPNAGTSISRTMQVVVICRVLLGWRKVPR